MQLVAPRVADSWKEDRKQEGYKLGGREKARRRLSPGNASVPGSGAHTGLLDPMEAMLVRPPCHWTPVSWALSGA